MKNLAKTFAVVLIAAASAFGGAQYVTPTVEAAVGVVEAAGGSCTVPDQVPAE